MNKIRKIIVVTFLVSLSIIIGSSRPTMAASLEESPEFQKALATSLSACYTRGAFRDEITLSSYGATGSVKSVLASTSSNVSAPIPYGYTSSSVQLPSMSCSDILSRALSKKGLSMPAKFEDAGPVLTKLGYTQVTSVDLDNEKTCFWFEYDVNVDDVEWIAGGGEYRTRDEVWRSKQVCLVEYTDESSGKAMTRLDSINSDNGGNSKILDIVRADGNTSVIKFQTQSWGVNDDWVSLDAHRNGTAADFMLTMYNAIIATKHGQTGTGEAGSYVNRYTLKGYQDQSSPIGSNVAGTRYVIQTGAAKTVPEDLFGVTRLFDQTNTYVLYQNYLMKFYGAMTLQVNPNDPTQDSLRTGASKDLGGYKKVKVYNKGKVEECYVKPNKTSGKLYGVSNNRFGGIDDATWQYPSPVFQVGYDDIIKFLNSTTPSGSELKSSSDYIIDANCAVDGQQEQTKPSNPGGGGGSTDTNGGNSSDGVYPCLEAAESLGWVLCPVLDFLGNTINSIYGYVENSFLVVNANMLGGETHEAWGKFRDYANIIFIIVFLVVILSQITGFGVSNYGVKKVLPRLIVMVILVNISFIICQLAVDISNIVGASIKSLLSDLSSVNLDGEISAGGIATEILSILGLGAAGALAPSVAAIIASSLATGTMGYWLLMILVTFIGFLIGILFAGILLAARQAGVILLVVLSPVAIACYALPNTKSIFDKWRRMFMSLLLVYPMCGAIVGGGQFATSLLINNNGGFFYTLIAMLLSIVPFFFIPTLVRTSLNSIGQLGARISNFGKGMGGRLTGTIRGSERFKDAQRELGLRRDEATVRRLDARRASGKTLTAAQQRRRARAYARADKGRREDIVGESYRDRRLLRYDEKRREQLEGNLAAKDFDERVSGAKVAYRDDPRMATEAAIVAEHDRLLEEYGNDPENIQLQSQLRALEEMAMEKGAPGQDLLQQSFARYITQNKKSWNDNKGLAMSKLGAGMATRYGKELNSSDKGFNTMMNHFAEKKFKLDSFSGNEQSGYSSAYDTKLAGFTAAGMSKATPGALQRGLAALQSGAFRANDPKDDAELKAQAQTLVNNATQALNDELIANDIKPAEKGFVQGISAYGASMPGHSSVFTNMGQGSLENLSQFVDSTNDSTALMSLGQNIQDAANSSHLYGEAETNRIKMIINKINSKAGTSYTFNPASMQIDKGQQQVPDAFDDPVMREYQQAQQAASNEYIPPSTAMADEDFRREIGK